MDRRKENVEIGNNRNKAFGNAEAEALGCQAEANQFLDLLNKDVDVSSGALAGVKTGGLNKPHLSDYFAPEKLFRAVPAKEKSRRTRKPKTNYRQRWESTISGKRSGVLRST